MMSLDAQGLRRAGAFGILLGLLLALWLLIMQPLWSASSSQLEQEERLSLLVTRLRQTVAETPHLRQQLAAVGQGQADRGAMFAAPSPMLAAANLQAEFTRIAAGDGVQLQSIQQLPQLQQEATTRIGLHAELLADTPQLAQLLYDLEAHTPILLVRSVLVRGNEQNYAQPAGRPPLSVQIELTAFAGKSE